MLFKEENPLKILLFPDLHVAGSDENVKQLENGVRANRRIKVKRTLSNVEYQGENCSLHHS